MSSSSSTTTTISPPLTRSEAVEAKKAQVEKKKPRRKRKLKILQKQAIWWGPEQDGKNPLKEYIPLPANMKRSEGIEIAYQNLVRMRKMTAKRYNRIQLARLHFDKYGEQPAGLHEILQ